jgi:prolipoprotein diacylglyceryl transferase
MIGAGIAVLISNRRYQSRGGAPGVVGDIAIYAIPAGIVGGRIYHVATSPEKYFGAGGDPISALYIWQGGLGIWGAIALGYLAAYILYRRDKRAGEIPFAILADALAPAILIAQAIGRFGNWFNKELFGRPLDAPWALEIPLRYRPIGYTNFETFHPVFLYEAIWCLALAAILIWWRRLQSLASGSIFALYVAGYAFGRFWIEQIRIDDSNLILGLRLNSWTAIVLFLIGASIAWRLNRRARR